MSAVVFDIGGVVCQFDPAARLRFMASRTTLTEQEIHEFIWAAPFSADHDRGLYSLEESCSFLRGVLRVDESNEWCSHLMMSAFTLNGAVLDLVREVRTRGKMTAFLTNNGPLLQAGIERELPALGEAFAKHFYSADLRACKPDPAVFRQVTARLNLEPSQIAFVDDTPANVVAAEQAGWRAFRYQGDLGGLKRWLLPLCD